MAEKVSSRDIVLTVMSACFGVILAFMGWVGMRMYDQSETTTILVTQQQENTRVNEIVYNTLPAIHKSITEIETTLKHQQKLLDNEYRALSYIPIMLGKDGQHVATSD